MNQDEVRAVVEEVVRYLAQKGYLAGPAASGPAPSAARYAAPAAPPKVTIGSAGKLFGETWVRRAPAAASAASARPVEGKAAEEVEHTKGADCPHCNPLSKLSQSDLAGLGADRLSVCHPTQSCSPIARTIDHTALKPNATQEEIAKLCEEARAYCFASVCVNPSYVALCARLLGGSGVRVCTVVGFPLGSTTPTVKAIEARDAIANGADEIDMVMNVGALKSGNDALVLEDMRAVREATRGRVLKVILETGLLSKEEKVRACRLAKEAGADFVKTSTGFGAGGATVEDIRLMRETVGPTMGVKASGGVRDSETAQAMLAAGATRIGASASIAIVTGKKAEGAKY